MNTMKQQLNIPKKVLVLGSGGLRIGQAGEFDYSGSQAIKAFKEEGIVTVVINPNIATVQTNRGLADRVYFLPVTTEYVTRVIEQERPDAIALSFGGQTALNVGLELEESGILRTHGVRVLGTPTRAIRITEDRDAFARELQSIHVDVARSVAVRSVAAGLKASDRFGFPLMIRSAFSLGGKGSGVIRSRGELRERLTEAFSSVSQVLIEEYLGGWKEIEYEVVRDSADNCVTVCNMENMDPMGIHTGESIVIAPSQTLTNAEYHHLRNVAIQTIRHLGIVGECNIQYALHPETAEYRVIEVNARLSRSSALASKATGYPLAWVAAKLALGYRLDEITNKMTGVTRSFFEPALDYVAIKMPRWDLTKFKSANRRIGSEMKSVGEVMALGRTFEEAIQKAARMIGVGVQGVIADTVRIEDCEDELRNPTDRRLFALTQAMTEGSTVQELHALTHINPWFLDRLNRIVIVAQRIRSAKTLTASLLQEAKRAGFSDQHIAQYRKTRMDVIRQKRIRLGIVPVIKQIDTLAGEFPAQTNYVYVTYHGTVSDVQPTKKSILVLGSGPYRIGSSVEFDWCCVQSVQTLRNCGYTTLMLNCNPETVSTDYDMCDRLYFDELSLERVLDIIDAEHPEAVNVSMGGQTPNTLALPLHMRGVRLLGTSAESIDRAEDRKKFSHLCDELGIDQPEWQELTTISEAEQFAERVGYPVLIRPSYVLSGAAMNIVATAQQLHAYLDQAAAVSPEHPVVISKFIEGAKEIEVDGVAQQGELVIYAFSEHIENAGIHSGDATVVLPPQKSYLETIRQIKKRTRAIVKALNITGPFNIQFLARSNTLRVIELNVRASRSFPFVSKATQYNFADLATRAMLGQDISGEYRTLDLDYVAVKAPQFSYARIKGADPVLHVEMGSTGEVACFGFDMHEALLKALIASDVKLPQKSILVSIGKDEDKATLAKYMRILVDLGYHLYGTEHTAEFLKKQHIPIKRLYKISEKKSPNIMQYIERGYIDTIINIPRSYTRKTESDGYRIRRMAIDRNITLFSNVQLVKELVIGLQKRAQNHIQLDPLSIDAYEK